jgi:ribonuclease HI
MGRNPEDKIIAYFDGACEPFNPGGIATWGYVVYKEGKIIQEACGLACEPFSKKATNNYAEYTALIKALEFCISHNYNHLTIKGDSQLVIYQMTGQYGVRSPNIMPLFEKAHSLAGKLQRVVFQWCPRESNKKADSLSKQAYMEYLKAHKDKIIMPFGKFKGRPLTWLAENQREYLMWLVKQSTIRRELRECIQMYLSK